jgi:hypothetical protein
MKATGICEAVMKDNGIVYLRPSIEDRTVFRTFFDKVTVKEEKNGARYFHNVTIALPVDSRTYKQNRTLWKLITTIFESQNGRKPNNEEKYNLYLDILDAYADRIPNQLTGNLRPVHISESDTVHGAKLIQACFDILVEMCDLDMDQQADVQDLFKEWQAWRSGLDMDPLDSDLSESEWREQHKVSDASGKGGYIELAHIVSRGADHSVIDKSWNWLALTHDEHIEVQHREGWEALLNRYPHLRGRVERARKLANQS